MNKVEGLHHLAICTADMKGQIEFFTDVLGMELVALYWMHGVENTWHGFLRLNDESCIAFVQGPGIKDIPVRLGQSHAGNPGSPCAAGAMQHLALRVKDEAELLVMRDRIRARQVPVLGPIDHGFCKSIYFAGPEKLTLELSYSPAAIDAEAWIDPEVVELAGIKPEELARFKAPAVDPGDGGQVPQPDLASPGPHMSGYTDVAYEKLMSMPDDRVLARLSATEPPVDLRAEA